MNVLKRVVITGGTGALGRAIQRRFLAENWDVVSFGSKNPELSNDESMNCFFDRNPCDLLICAAGIVRDQPLARLDEDVWDEVFHLNYTFAKRCSLAAIPAMNQGSQVLFISSYAAIHPAVGQSAYATAKAALIGLTKDLATHYGPNGIRVNAIMPGFMETPMTREVSMKRKQAVRESHVMGQFNTPDIVAEFIHVLHERMPFTSGQLFQLDSRT